MFILCLFVIGWFRFPFSWFYCSLRGRWLRVAFLLMLWCMCFTAPIASSAAPKKPLAVRLKTCESWTFQRPFLRLKPLPLKAALLWRVFPFLIPWEGFGIGPSETAHHWKAFPFLIQSQWLGVVGCFALSGCTSLRHCNQKQGLQGLQIFDRRDHSSFCDTDLWGGLHRLHFADEFDNPNLYHRNRALDIQTLQFLDQCEHSRVCDKGWVLGIPRLHFSDEYDNPKLRHCNRNGGVQRLQIPEKRDHSWFCDTDLGSRLQRL